MKKHIKIRIIIIAIFIVVWSSFFITDMIKTNNDQVPIFCVKTADYDDGGSARYTGLFYNVYHVKRLNIISSDPSVIDYGYYMRLWFYPQDKLFDDVIA